MKKTKRIYYIGISMLLTVLVGSCESELDLEPITSQTADKVFEDPLAYKQFLAKIYGGIAINGQAAGDADIQGIDGNFSNYLRLLFTVQELSTDQAIIAWNDGTIHDIHNHVWTPANEFLSAMYSRIYFQVGMVNQFLRETTEAKLDERGVDTALRAEIQLFRDEARFMRALSYWHGIDNFGNIPFVTETDKVGNFFPEQRSRGEVFEFIESELLEIKDSLLDPRGNEYGRADKAAVWMLLAKLYLNAEVYTGVARYSDALPYIVNVIESGYTLSPNYNYLYLADNDRNGAENEVIFSVLFDGINNAGFGGTTYLTHAAIGGTMNPAEFGVNGGWWGIRTTENFVQKFADISGDTDSRAMFYTDSQTLEIEDPFNFQNGYAVTKYRNVDVNGAIGSDVSGNIVDIDFPMFRLADAYLMYAEVFVRGAGGDQATALNYVNLLRERAYGDTSGNITASELNPDFILDERSRELYWECHRRTDLIRFGQFSSQGIWPWKGNVPEGRTTESFRDLYPIPVADVIANPNITQNDGY
ncbi:RagB/SusD family nutrient uptake outer membrane protein [Flagellimonas allohymeniacidonis]|uniref:RagB/SusD family nutrient uptake outer membrane protein n=1 Tax=Flagellimonas allohymeniacidonis TaxID=2517819 RepID=A0A4Q8QLW4_9FLAO|nr:RagB/SusD family nutrient uptake outer membrane protein [Allomuricauda hymeniacidonis]TAI49579.1 RagB/SusD family nutrient uptake outer membrane protein [Allomuricauda hymeniacidonis]